VVAVLFAALNARSASEEATRAVDDAAAAQEMATGVDRMATLGRSALSSDDRRQDGELAAIRRRTLTLAATLGRSDEDGGAAVGLSDQVAATDRALTAKPARATVRRRAGANLTSLQSAARSLSLVADSAQADDRAARRLTWTLLGALVLVTLLLGSFWHPKLGEVPPGDFIPVAEETGLIISPGSGPVGGGAR